MLLTLYKFKYLFSKGNDKIVNVEMGGKGKFYIYVPRKSAADSKKATLQKLQYVMSNTCNAEI
jgi:hypothetical protein